MSDPLLVPPLLCLSKLPWLLAQSASHALHVGNKLVADGISGCIIDLDTDTICDSEDAANFIEADSPVRYVRHFFYDRSGPFITMISMTHDGGEPVILPLYC